MSEEEFDGMIGQKQQEVRELCEKDVIYKTLVDNYVKASTLAMKGKGSSEEVSNSINALAAYTNQLVDNNRLSIIKALQITNEDIADMWKQNIIDSETIFKICRFKRGDNNNE